jgi:hypothetical protein
MTHHTIYDAKGEIVSVIRASDQETVDLNTPPGCSRIEGRYPPQEYYVKDGVPKPYPEKPSDFCSFDFEAEVWVEDTDAALAAASKELRAERDRLLVRSDWTQLPDAPADKQAWAAYRQALRDLPADTTGPRNPLWPSPPGPG